VTPARAGAVTENEVEDYLSEREQVDRIRQWWKENGAWIIVGIGGGVLSLAGWNWWQGYQLERAEQASAIYSVAAEADTRAASTRCAPAWTAWRRATVPRPTCSTAGWCWRRRWSRAGDPEWAIAALEQVLARGPRPAARAHRALAPGAAAGRAKASTSAR
jgi:hypothetical protein